MHVTKVVVNNLTPREYGVCGEFSVVLDDELKIHKVRVAVGRKGHFVIFPNTGRAEDDGNGSSKFHDLVHPIKDELRQEIWDAVLKKYNSELEKKQSKKEE